MANDCEVPLHIVGVLGQQSAAAADDDDDDNDGTGYLLTSGLPRHSAFRQKLKTHLFRQSYPDIVL